MIPTYQEAGNIVEVLRRVRAASRASVLVVDDNSPDGTADLAEAAAREVDSVAVLRQPGRGGLGGAYRAGFAWGLDRGFEAFVEMDADLSHDPAALPTLLEPLEQGADLVIGSRYVPGGSIPTWSFHRRALSRWGNRYTAALLGLGVVDATSGYRAYRADTLRDIDFYSVRADGYGFQIETAYRTCRRGRKVVEVPIEFADRTEGASKMSARIIVEALVLVTAWGLRDRARSALGRVGRARRR